MMSNFYPSRITNSFCWFNSINEYKFVYIGKVLCYSGRSYSCLPVAENFVKLPFSDPSKYTYTIKQVSTFSLLGENVKNCTVTCSPTGEETNQPCRESSPMGERAKQPCGIHSHMGEQSSKAAAYLRPGAKIVFCPVPVVLPWATDETVPILEKNPFTP